MRRNVRTRLLRARTAGDLKFRLYRRVIEIADARLLLRPYLDPAVTEAARHAATAQGLHGDQLRATIRATELAAALDAHAAATPCPTPPAAARKHPHRDRPAIRVGKQPYSICSVPFFPSRE